MTAFTVRRPSRRPLVVVIGILAIAIGTQVASVWNGDQAGLDEPLLAAPPRRGDRRPRRPGRCGRCGGANAVAVPAPAGAVPGAGANAVAVDPAPAVPTHVDPAPAAPANAAPKGFDPTAELTRIRADVDFWAARLTAHPNDIVAAVKLAESDVAEARMTGDVTDYLRAEQAADAAIVAQPGYLPAESMRASILVSLHRFPQARELARWILFRSPADSTALGVLGDASLELGDLTTAATAYSRLAIVADGSAAQVRAARLAFVEGDPAAAVAGDRTAVASATNDEGLEGDALGFYHVTLGETLIAAGDPAGARSAFEAALAVRPDLPAALVGLAKLDAFDGQLSTAIAELDTAIAAIPLPDSLARRADLLTLRGEPGDARKAQADMATVEAIAQLAGEAGSVYDRGLSLYLSDHGLEPERAVTLARDELAIRPDVYGYDTLAWALLNAGDAAGADAPMQSALAAGTKDARLWYHAGLIALANGRPDEAATDLRGALALGPALDPDVPRAGDRRPGDDPMRTSVRAALRGTVLALVLVPVVAAVALAHPLGQLHDQPLRGDPRGAVAGGARRRHRRGRDPDLPGEPGLRPRRRRDPVAGRDGGGARVDVRVGGPGPEPDRRRDRRAAGPDRGRPHVPAGQRRAVDDAQRVHVRGSARFADRRGLDGRVRGRLRGVADRLARDDRGRIGRDGHRDPASRRRA